MTTLNNKVEVYKNLHNGKFSIRQNGLVIGHADNVLLMNVSFKVAEAGRQRVLKECKKNVHSFVCGDLINAENFTSFKGRKLPSWILTGPLSDSIDHWDDISYNPYKWTSFVNKASGMPVRASKMVYLASVPGTFKALI
jgi:hypothetical protein